jgi:glutaredoxin 3
VKQQLDMAQRLQPRSEARLRSPDTFCHSADATALERVEVKDAVCLAEPERSQDDGLGLVGPSGHRVLKCRDLVCRGIAGAADFVFQQVMGRVQMYTTTWCGYCVRAKTLLDGKGIEFDEINLDDDPEFRQKLLELTGSWTVPQILINGRPIGGYTELWRLDKSGQLDEELAA